MSTPTSDTATPEIDHDGFNPTPENWATLEAVGHKGPFRDELQVDSSIGIDLSIEDIERVVDEKLGNKPDDAPVLERVAARERKFARVKDGVVDLSQVEIEWAEGKNVNPISIDVPDGGYITLGETATGGKVVGRQIIPTEPPTP